MNFVTPTGDRGLTFEQRIVRDTERLRWKMEKAAQRRRASQDGFYDEQTVLVPKLLLCIVEGCDKPIRAKLRCGMHYKRMRRRTKGLTN